MFPNTKLFRRFLLILGICMMGLSVTSCNDPDDEPDDIPPKDEQNSNAPALTGTWYFYEHGVVDYEIFLKFNSDGTFFYAEESYDRSYGTYDFDHSFNRWVLHWDYDDETFDEFVDLVSDDTLELYELGTFIRRR